MKKSKFTEEQIAYGLRQVEGGAPVPDVCRQLGVSEAIFYIWKRRRLSRFGTNVTSCRDRTTGRSGGWNAVNRGAGE